ncbi:hypothetical protein HNV12_05335 [Methanococcoides sp. SA1]|nr:hypothetical protein [Methanococcoides sp. SA1]
MIKTVIFVVQYPFSQRDYERFGIEILQKNGFGIQVWDLSNIMHPEIAKISVTKNNSISHLSKIFSNWNDVKENISKKLKNSFLICLIGYGYGSYPLYRAMSKKRIPYAVLMANALPQIDQNKRDNVFKRLKNASLLDIINYVYQKLPHNLIGMSSASVVLTGGKASLNSDYPIDKDTDILWLHSLDYDIYLNDSEKSTDEKQKITVFLDEFLPFHPDFIRMGIEPPVKAEEYYPKLNRFFDAVEEHYNVKVVIAAHPRSDYENRPDYFNGRTVIKNRTSSLIKKCESVIIHSSTSINFPIIYNKPLIFITSTSLRKGYTGPYIDKIAQIFGKEPFNLDQLQNIDWKSEYTINKDAYAKYKEMYIKTPMSEDALFWQQVANYLKL